MEKNQAMISEEPMEEGAELAALFPNIGSQLRGALSTLYLAARQVATPAMREQFQDMDSKAALIDQSYFRLLRMVQNLDDSAYITGQRLYYKDYFDIVEPVGRICAEIGDLAAVKGVSLRFSCPMETHICLHDPRSMKILLLQLLSNAVKFTESGGSVSVSLAVKGERVDLSVTDTGCGIAPDLLPTLFDRYLHSGRMDPPQHGLGLGLPICRAIAEAHGGVILAESKPGRGSKFTLSIPNLTMNPSQLKFCEPRPEYTGGFSPALLALCDSLPPQAFLLRNKS